MLSKGKYHTVKYFFRKIDIFIQLACPRLSIDWGYTFDIPLLTAFEFFTLKDSKLWNDERLH